MNITRDISHPVIVFTLSPTGLSVARTLGPKGVRVYGVDYVRFEIGHFSRWIRHDKRISYLPPGEELLRNLIAFGKEQKKKPVIFLAGDPYIDFVAENREYLQSYFIMPESMCSKVNSVLLHKETFYSRCDELGVATPLTFFPKSEEEAADVAERLRYPAIVKPTLGHQVRRKLKGQKLIKVDNAVDLLRWWRILRSWGDTSILQEVIQGPETNITVAGLYMNSGLECKSLFTAVKNRQYPPMYGSGSYMEAKWLPDIAKLSIDIVTKLGYKGVCGTEFKWDERDEEWKLIEINCRPTLWFALTRAAGIDVIWDAYCDLVGDPNPVHMGKQDNTVRWQFLVRDIVSAIHFYRCGDLSKREFFRTVINPRRKEYAILSFRDPGTTLFYPIDTFLKYFKYFLKKN